MSGFAIGDRLTANNPVLRDALTASAASIGSIEAIDADLRRIGEALSNDADVSESEVDRLVRVDAVLHGMQQWMQPEEFNRRIGLTQILLGAVHHALGHRAASAAAFDLAIKSLKSVGMQDLPAEALQSYAAALLRARKLGRAARAIIQVARRGYGRTAGPLAVRIADELRFAERPREGTDLMREFSKAMGATSIENDQQLIDALERHDLPEAAAFRCLELGDRLDVSDGRYLDTYLRAIRLSARPVVVKSAVRAIAAVDTERALAILDDPRTRLTGTDEVVVRAEVLALRGHVAQARDLLDSLAEDDGRTHDIAAARGLVAYLADDYRTAVDELLVAVEHDQDDRRSALLLGDSVHRVEVPDQARGRAEKALLREVRRFGPSGQALAVLARVQRVRGNSATAAATLEQAANQNDAPAWVYFEVGEVHRLAGRSREGMAFFDAALELEPDSARAIGSRGQAKAELGELDEAIGDLATALQLEPSLDWVFDSATDIADVGSDLLDPVLEALRMVADDPSREPRVRDGAARRAAYLLTSRGDGAGALQLLERAAAYSSGFELTLSIAWVRWRMGDLTQARQGLWLAAQEKPDLTWIVPDSWAIAVADEPLRSSLIDKMLDAVDDPAVGVPVKIAVLSRAADALADESRELRCDLIGRALLLNPTIPKAWANFGDALLECDQPTDAVVAYETAVGLDSEDSQIRHGLGVARTRAGDPRRGARDLRRALAMGVDDERRTLLELAEALATNSPPAARDIYRRLLRLDPGDVWAARGLSELDVAEGRVAEAMDVLQHALSHTDHDEYLMSDIALLSLKMEDIELAVVTALDLARTHPDSAVAAQTRGMLHNEFGNWPEAVEAFDDALRLDPTRADAHGWRAWALEYQGRLSDAVHALENALRYDRDPYYSRARALILRSLYGREGEAAVRDALALTASLPARDALTTAHEAFCFLALGQFDSAIKQLMQALDQDPSDVATQLDLALALVAAGRSRAGRGEYRRALARVARRHVRRRIGLLRVARIDLETVQGWFPDVLGFEDARRLITQMLADAECEQDTDKDLASVSTAPAP